MAEWVKIGSRYINLDNVAEVRVNEGLRVSRLYFVGGGVEDLDEDDTDILVAFLVEQVKEPQEPHRTILAPKAT